MKRTLFIVVAVVLLVLIGWGSFSFITKRGPQGEDYSTFFEAQSQDHIEVDAEHPAYNSNPPSGGWHYTLTAKKRYYSEPVPDEYVVHNLEHGDIWITYHPRVSEAVKDELKQFAFAKILITPRAENDTDIALVAWERVDAFNLDDEGVPEGRIRDFIKRYRDKGPEKIPAGAMEATFN